MLGAAFGDVVGMIDPSLQGQAGTFALVGLGAVFAGAARAPITAVIIMFELTGEYSIILPIMLAIVVATGVSKLLSPDTIYTLKLSRRGVDLTRHPGTELLRATPVAAVMDNGHRALDGSLSAAEGSRLLLASGKHSLPVTDADGHLAGVVTLQLLSAKLAGSENERGHPLSVLAEQVATAEPSATLDSVVGLVMDSPAGGGLPVAQGGVLKGWLSQKAVLQLLSQVQR
jgi:CIC family chloride channel protein